MGATTPKPASTLDRCSRLSGIKGLYIDDIDAVAITSVSLDHEDLSKSTVSRGRTPNINKLTLKLKDEFAAKVSGVLIAFH